MSRPSSPFRGVTKSDLALLRGLAEGVEAWVDAARAGRYYYPKYAPEILNNSGGFRQAEILSVFQDRAWARLYKSPNWDAIAKAHNLERLRKYEPQAYQVLKMREELECHIAKCETNCSLNESNC